MWSPALSILKFLEGWKVKLMHASSNWEHEQLHMQMQATMDSPFAKNERWDSRKRRSALEDHTSKMMNATKAELARATLEVRQHELALKDDLAREHTEHIKKKARTDGATAAAPAADSPPFASP